MGQVDGCDHNTSLPSPEVPAGRQLTSDVIADRLKKLDITQDSDESVSAAVGVSDGCNDHTEGEETQCDGRSNDLEAEETQCDDRSHDAGCEEKQCDGRSNDMEAEETQCDGCNDDVKDEEKHCGSCNNDLEGQVCQENSPVLESALNTNFSEQVPSVVDVVTHSKDMFISDDDGEKDESEEAEKEAEPASSDSVSVEPSAAADCVNHDDVISDGKTLEDFADPSVNDVNYSGHDDIDDNSERSALHQRPADSSTVMSDYCCDGGSIDDTAHHADEDEINCDNAAESAANDSDDDGSICFHYSSRFLCQKQRITS